jgi:microcystin-dependent protein
MKKSYLILFFLATFFSVSNAFAQANVQATGISIQGIARDEFNSALTNIDALSLQFKIYYLNQSSVEVDISNTTANVKTDNFGVFSYVMNIDKTLFTAISNSAAYLKVMQGSTVFSNEKLQAVPYAVHAQNGVPTGTIMAFIGTTAPEGWLLCNGASFADNAANAKLRELLGSFNTPDLTARYLRGTGTSEGRGGIGLKGTQYDEFKPHNHNVNLTTTNGGEHYHDIWMYNGGNSMPPSYMNRSITTGIESPARDNNDAPYGTSLSGNHSHTWNGNTADSGNATTNETRPYSYGVNYIIKI